MAWLLLAVASLLLPTSSPLLCPPPIAALPTSTVLRPPRRKAKKPSGEDINALEQHIKNLLSPSTPGFFNTH